MTLKMSSVLKGIARYGDVYGPRQYHDGDVYVDISDPMAIKGLETLRGLVELADAYECEMKVCSVHSHATVRFVFDPESIDLDTDLTKKSISTGYN